MIQNGTILNTGFMENDNELKSKENLIIFKELCDH